MKAKTVTLFAQITGALWIAAGTGWKLFKVPESVEIKDIIISGVGIVACFFPVTISVILDKVKSIKVGDFTND